jgi:hypothetical protein
MAVGEYFKYHLWNSPFTDNHYSLETKRKQDATGQGITAENT